MSREEAAALAVAQIETGDDGVTVAEDIDRTFARTVLDAVDAWEVKQDIHRFKIDPETVNRAALAFCQLPESPADACEDCRDDALAALRALRSNRPSAVHVSEGDPE